MRRPRPGSSRRSRSVSVAVTGTNGKTSIASFVRQIWAACGHPGGEPRHARRRDRGRARRGLADDARPADAASRPRRAQGAGHRPRGDGSLEPWARPAAARRRDVRRGGLHQPQPRPPRLSRRHGQPIATPSCGCSPTCSRDGGAAVVNIDDPGTRPSCSRRWTRGVDADDRRARRARASRSPTSPTKASASASPAATSASR